MKRKESDLMGWGTDDINACGIHGDDEMRMVVVSKKTKS